MMQVLWLTSWYPNKYDLYNGDFIQRHAISTSAFCNLHVIHAQLVPPSFQKQAVVTETIELQNFTETILYIRQPGNDSFFNRIFNQLNYERHFKRAINNYISKNHLPQLVHVQVPVKAGKLGLWLKEKYQLNFVLTEHYGIYNNHAPDKFVLRNKWFKHLTKKVIDEAIAFLPVSKNLGIAVNELVTQKPFEAVYNVVDTAIFNYQQKHKKDACWLVHVSTMNHPKNPEGLLRAFANAYKKNNHLKLRMVGEAIADVVNYAASLGLKDAVVFTGMLAQIEVAELLHQSAAFVLFSNYENMPCVIAEALCCGLPVISTNVGGIPEIITKENGILINAEDEEALTTAIIRVCNNPYQFQPENIAAKAVQTFGYNIIGRQIVSIYQKTIKNTGNYPA